MKKVKMEVFSFFFFTILCSFLIEVWNGLLPNLSSVAFGSFQIGWCYFGVSGGESSSYPGGTHYPKRDYFSTLNIHWKDWCWSWSSNTLATWCEEPSHWKKTLMLGKIEGRRRWQQRTRWLDGITNSMDMNLSKLWGMVKDRSLAWCRPWGRKELDMTEQ